MKFYYKLVIMISNFSTTINHTLMPDYPILDSDLSFSDYIARCHTLITERRFSPEQIQGSTRIEQIIQANSPYECYPDHPIRTDNGRLKYGVLLIHGLLDSPFSLKDIGLSLQKRGILARAILLPGHGTIPSDLLQVSYHDWIQTVRYGVESLRKEVDQIFLIGYSTGAALSVYQALQNNGIHGIILLSPAIKIKAPVDFMKTWHYFLKWISKDSNRQWFYLQDELDYSKYLSIPFNAVNQVSKLTAVIQEYHQLRGLTTPLFMIISREDETISSASAIRFFSSLRNQNSRMLLYSAKEHHYPDPRIFTRISRYPELNIKNLSHVSIPFAPHNPHYGEQGDYFRASRIDQQDCIYGAYNRIEGKLSDFFYNLGLLKKMRHELTYNPDFNFMAEKISQFILSEKQ